MGNKKPYWKKLKDKYLKANSEDIFKWYKQNIVQRNFLLRRFGASSWNINDFANMLRADKISESHFRELVQYEMNENFNKILKDKYNSLNSRLSELEKVKLTKRSSPNKS